MRCFICCSGLLHSCDGVVHVFHLISALKTCCALLNYCLQEVNCMIGFSDMWSSSFGHFRASSVLLGFLDVVFVNTAIMCRLVCIRMTRCSVVSHGRPYISLSSLMWVILLSLIPTVHQLAMCADSLLVRVLITLRKQHALGDVNRTARTRSKGAACHSDENNVRHEEIQERSWFEAIE